MGKSLFRVILQVMPHNHQKKVAKFYYADKNMLLKAIENAVETQKKWDRVPIPERYNLFSYSPCFYTDVVDLFKVENLGESSVSNGERISG